MFLHRSQNQRTQLRGAEGVMTERQNIKSFIFKVLDTIELQMQQRLSSLERFLGLLDFSKFHLYEEDFPDSAFNSLRDTCTVF